MAELNSARTTIEVGKCPACGDSLEMILAVYLGTSRLEMAPGGHAEVSFEFPQPQVIGAVLKPHDCIARKPGVR